MKKLIIIAFVLLLMACGNSNKDIKQNIGYDNITNSYSITTSFENPKTYSSNVYCPGPQIDSIRKEELTKATYIQNEMLKKN